MESAMLLKKRGYNAVLLEESGVLGGSAILASKAPCKHMVPSFSTPWPPR